MPESGEELMGFPRNRKLYKLDFSDTEYDGLEIKVRGLTTGEYFELVSLTGPTDGGDKEADGMVRMLATHLVAWNLEDGGTPVPTTYEALKDTDFTMVTAITNAWIEALSDTPRETAKKSQPGASPLTASIPTETL